MPLGKADWSVDPFSGETDGDRLFGRGTSDMKGGTAAIVVAAERLAALGCGSPSAGLELVLCAGEETGCEGALALAGADGLLGRCGAVLVAEPTTNYPCVAHKGVVWADAVARGKTAHGSMPHLGENAIFKLARAVLALEDFALRRRGAPAARRCRRCRSARSRAASTSTRCPTTRRRGSTCGRCPGWTARPCSPRSARGWATTSSSSRG